MQLAFNARILATEKLRGWSRYTANLIRELSNLDCKIHLLTDRKINKNHLVGAQSKNLEVHTFPSANYLLWEQWALPKKCQQLKVELLHCPHHFGLPLMGSFKKILTLHDTIEDSYYNHQKNIMQRLRPSDLQMDLLRSVARHKADHILTVSETSRRDIINYYGISPESVSVTYNGVDPNFQIKQAKSLEATKKQFDIRPPYFFYVGGFDKRKNIPFLIKTFKKFLQQKKAQLVIAGVGGQEIKDLAHQTLNSSEIDHFLFIDGPTDQDLISLYHHAHCFLYPSLYEGFGLQIVESMRMETPVLASRTSCFPEILANDECLFDPLKEEDLINLMNKTLENQEYYNRIQQKAKQRGLQFQWEDTVARTYQIYRNLLKGKRQTLR